MRSPKTNQLIDYSLMANPTDSFRETEGNSLYELYNLLLQSTYAPLSVYNYLCLQINNLYLYL
jgi:hypothetical protein